MLSFIVWSNFLRENYNHIFKLQFYLLFELACRNSVSYTHLDVYKRQIQLIVNLQMRADLSEIRKIEVQVTPK